MKEREPTLDSDFRHLKNLIMGIKRKKEMRYIKSEIKRTFTDKWHV